MATTLYDAHGNPIRRADLTREKGGATTSGVRSPYHQSQIAGMRPERLARLLREADAGNPTAFFVLAEEIEERDNHYSSVLTTRKLGVSGAPFTVQAPTDKRRDIKIADDVRDTIVNRPEFGDLVLDMLDALGKGVSMVEIMWTSDGGRIVPERYEWRDPTWFTWDSATLREPRLITDESPMGEALTPGKWILHTPKLKSGVPVRGGLARPVSIAWAMKTFTARDWMTFLHVYGMPFRVGEYESGATKEDRDALLDAVISIGTDIGGIIPKGANIKFESTNSAANVNAFIGTVEYWDKQISKRVLGQTMTTDEGTGRGKAQASEQSKQKLELKRHDASRVAAAIRAQLVAPFVRMNYGPDAPVPMVMCETRTDDEIAIVVDYMTKLADYGVPIEASWARDICGIPEPERDKQNRLVARVLVKGGSTGDDAEPTVAPEDKPSAQTAPTDPSATPDAPATA